MLLADEDRDAPFTPGAASGSTLRPIDLGRVQAIRGLLPLRLTADNSVGNVCLFLSKRLLSNDTPVPFACLPSAGSMRHAAHPLVRNLPLQARCATSGDACFTSRTRHLFPRD